MSSETNPPGRRCGGIALAACGAATAALLALSFPPAELSLLPWCALVPLLVALRARCGKTGLLLVWLSGLAFGCCGFFWARHVTWLGMLLLGFYVSLYFTLFCYGVRWMRFGKGVPLALAAPLVWTALEHVRGTLLTGLPYLFLAHTQYRSVPVIQMADLTGAAGVTFWIVAVNGFLADAVLYLGRLEPRLRPPRVLAGGLAVLALSIAAQLYGAYRLNTLVIRTGPALAVLQGNIPQSVKLMPHITADYMFDTYMHLTRRAHAHRPRPAMIFWPETMAPSGTLDFCRNAPGNEYVERLAVYQRDCALVVSANAAPDGARIQHNSAFLLPRGGCGPTMRYDKIHLVPFGEYVPLEPLLRRVIAPLIPYEGGLAPGKHRVLFTVQGWRFAPTICYEDAFPDLVAGFARGKQKMDFIVNLTNEGWFRDGTELDQHLAIGVFRAIECRAGFVRAANTGISAFISPTGRIISILVREGRDREVAGVLHGLAMTADGSSPYLAVGELFAKLCVIGWLFCMVWLARSGIKGWWRRRGRK